MSTSVHLYPSSFTNETRILRICRTLVEQRIFTHVWVIAALRTPDLPEYEEIGQGRSVWRIPTRSKRLGLFSKSLNMIEWSFRAWAGIRRMTVSSISAHSLSVLPLAWIVAKMNGSRLIYEPHEIETETTEMRGVRSRVSKALERWFANSANVLIVTSEGHAQWYRKNISVPPVLVVRNAPYRDLSFGARKSIIRSMFQIQADARVFIYQGAIARPRGVDVILDVFGELDMRWHIVFMGFGPDVDKVKRMVKLHANIHYLPAVPPAEVRRYTEGADIGIHMMDDSCINHLYALPNKPMEYMNAGLPAIVSDLPEMGQLIRGSGGGWVVPVNDRKALSSLIRDLTQADIDARRQCAINWGSENCWEIEEKILIQAYENLGYICGRE